MAVDVESGGCAVGDFADRNCAMDRTAVAGGRVGGEEKLTMNLSNKSLAILGWRNRCAAGVDDFRVRAQARPARHVREGPIADPRPGPGADMADQGASEGKSVTLQHKVDLQRQTDQFVIVQREDYPAAVSAVNDLLNKVLDIHCQAFNLVRQPRGVGRGRRGQDCQGRTAGQGGQEPRDSADRIEQVREARASAWAARTMFTRSSRACGL